MEKSSASNDHDPGEMSAEAIPGPRSPLRDSGDVEGVEDSSDLALETEASQTSEKLQLTQDTLQQETAVTSLPAAGKKDKSGKPGVLVVYCAPTVKPGPERNVAEPGVDIRQISVGDHVYEKTGPNSSALPQIVSVVSNNSTIPQKWTPKSRTTGHASCAVAICPSPRGIKYFRFPKTDDDRCAKWEAACRRADKFNAKSACICSFHFRDEDYERDLMSELMGTAPKKRLRQDAVPSRYLMAEDLEALNKVIAEANMLKKQPHLKQRIQEPSQSVDVPEILPSSVIVKAESGLDVKRASAAVTRRSLVKSDPSLVRRDRKSTELCSSLRRKLVAKYRSDLASKLASNAASAKKSRRKVYDIASHPLLNPNDRLTQTAVVKLERLNVQRELEKLKEVLPKKELPPLPQAFAKKIQRLHCAISGCESNSSTDGVTLFAFPKRTEMPDLALAWHRLATRHLPLEPPLPEADSEEEASRRICSRHFAPSDYSSASVGGMPLLKFEVVPFLNLAEESPLRKLSYLQKQRERERAEREAEKKRMREECKGEQRQLKEQLPHDQQHHKRDCYSNTFRPETQSDHKEGETIQTSDWSARMKTTEISAFVAANDMIHKILDLRMRPEGQIQYPEKSKNVTSEAELVERNWLSYRMAFERNILEVMRKDQSSLKHLRSSLSSKQRQIRNLRVKLDSLTRKVKSDAYRDMIFREVAKERFTGTMYNFLVGNSKNTNSIWTDEEVITAMLLRAISKRAYIFLRRGKHMPLPEKRVLSQYVKKWGMKDMNDVDRFRDPNDPITVPSYNPQVAKGTRKKKPPSLTKKGQPRKSFKKKATLEAEQALAANGGDKRKKVKKINESGKFERSIVDAPIPGITNSYGRTNQEHKRAEENRKKKNSHKRRKEDTNDEETEEAEESILEKQSLNQNLLEGVVVSVLGRDNESVVKASVQQQLGAGEAMPGHPGLQQQLQQQGVNEAGAFALPLQTQQHEPVPGPSGLQQNQSFTTIDLTQLNDVPSDIVRPSPGPSSCGDTPDPKDMETSLNTPPPFYPFDDVAGGVAVTNSSQKTNMTAFRSAPTISGNVSNLTIMTTNASVRPTSHVVVSRVMPGTKILPVTKLQKQSTSNKSAITMVDLATEDESSVIVQEETPEKTTKRTSEEFSEVEGNKRSRPSQEAPTKLVPISPKPVIISVGNAASIIPNPKVFVNQTVIMQPLPDGKHYTLRTLDPKMRPLILKPMNGQPQQQPSGSMGAVLEKDQGSPGTEGVDPNDDKQMCP